MAKNETAIPETETPPATASFSLSLDEFCTRLSQGDKRVELIAGFHHTELTANRVSDTESNYRARYTDFSKKTA